MILLSNIIIIIIIKRVVGCSWLAPVQVGIWL